jgi:membrane protease subunit (stomatin/prohibitin family)
MLKTVFDIPASMDDLNLVMKTELYTDFEGLGLKLHDFYIQSISLPDEVQKMIDTRTGMNAVGNLDQYMKLKIADSLGDAAKNNDSTGVGLGLGAGIGMGMALPNMIQQSMHPQNNENVSDKLKKLKELIDMGVLSQQEFDDKKKELLKQL